MLISAETVTRVREASPIVEVIGEYLPNMKRAGKDYKALCPFHHEKTPSFMVSPSKEIFHCFGCGVGGDVFKFLMELEKCSYPEAVTKLAERKGIPVQREGSTPEAAESEKRRKALLEILKRAAQYYHTTLLESRDAESARAYLREKRGLSEETIRRFQLGWAPQGPRDLLQTALKSGFTEADLARAGLVIRREGEGERWLDWFRGRVIFPIFSLKGEIVAFGGRILETGRAAQGNPPPKYLNSPETEVFRKGKNLYGFYHGARQIRDKQEALVVEGYMDVIACHQAGVETAVAPLGTSLTGEQCQILKRYVDQVTLLFDSDLAGDSAAIRGMELLLEFGFLPTIARLSGAKDADEYLKSHSLAEFAECLKRGLNIVEFNLEIFLKRHSDLPRLTQKTLAVKEILPALFKIDNEVTRSELIKDLSRKLEISEESIYIEMRKQKEILKGKMQNRAAPAAAEGAPPGAADGKAARKVLSSAEEELLQLIITHPELRPDLRKAARGMTIFHEPLCAECYRLLEENPAASMQELLAALPPQSANWLTGLLFPRTGTADPAELFASLVKRIEVRNKGREREMLEKSVIEMLNSGRTASSELSRYQKLTQALKGSA